MNKPLKRLRSRLGNSPWIGYTLLLGLSFVVVGVVFYIFLLHQVINNVIQKVCDFLLAMDFALDLIFLIFTLPQKITITEGSEAYDKWRALPMPIYYRYYFFNITNAPDVEKVGVKPILEEVGPFTYRSRWVKRPIIFHPNGTVTYRERKTMWFVPSLSVQSERKRNLVTINGPLSVTLALLQRAPLMVRNIVSLGLSTITEGFFIKRSARELLFDGYPEMLTSFGPLLNPNIPNSRGRFAWLFDRNNTDDGMFNVYTGKDNFESINLIDRFNGKRKLNYWKENSECNELKGSTDGQIIAPKPEQFDAAGNVKPREFLLFHPEICRKIRFVSDTSFNGTSLPLGRFRAQFGGDLTPDEEGPDAEDEPLPFQVERFRPEVNFLSSGDNYPPNSCYTSKITPSRPELGDLLLNIRADRNQSMRFSIRPVAQARSGRLHFKPGVFDLSTCKYGAPILLSYPHFLGAHPNYRENVAGMRPDHARHDFYMLIEPRTGTSLHSRARIQINVFISKPPWISRYRYIPEIVFPVFWQELAADVPTDVVSHIGWALTKPFAIADYFSLALIAIGVTMISVATWVLVRSITSSSMSVTSSAAATGNDIDTKVGKVSLIQSSSYGNYLI